MKTIAKVVGHRTYESFRNSAKVINVSAIDTPVPAIIYNPDTHEATHGEVHRIRGHYPIGTTLEIESTFHQAGELIDGYVLSHDCYIHDIRVID